MPVLLIVGPTPALFVASTLEITQGVSEYEWLGGLLGEPLEMIRGKHTGLPLPHQGLGIAFLMIISSSREWNEDCRLARRRDLRHGARSRTAN